MEEILKYIQDFGFMTVFAGAGLYFLFKFALLKYQQMERSTLEQNVADPKKHGFFQKVEFILRYKLPEIELRFKGQPCQGRTTLFRDMLKIKFEAWKRNIAAVCAVDYQNMSKSDIRLAFTEAMLNLVSEYESTWEQNGIPRIVVDKFHKWHDNHSQMFLEAIESITGGTCFSSPREIMNAILEMNAMMLLLTILDAEKTLGDLNGELSGMEYKTYKLL